MAGPATPPAGWYGDPAQRHQYRYWNGAEWTVHVADGAVTATDPLEPAPVIPAAASPAPGPAGPLSPGPSPLAPGSAAPVATEVVSAVPASSGTASPAPSPLAPASHAPAAGPLSPGPLFPGSIAPGPLSPGSAFAVPSPAPAQPPVAGWAVTAAAAPAGSAGPAAPAGPAAGRPGRRKWAILGIAIVAVLGLVSGLLVWAPWTPPPLLRPAGLTAAAVTTSSLAFRWSPPATGPAPDRYVILHNGKVIASVPGTVTSYRAAGLAPGTAYLYLVAAVRGGKRSALSRGLVLTTATPPLSAAPLKGGWTVTVTIVRGAAGLSGLSSKTWTESWSTAPKCPTGPCAVKLSGSLNGRPFKATLTRKGTLYRGKSTANVFPCGSGSVTFPIPSTLIFRIKVSSANVYNAVWMADGWRGTMTVNAPYTASGSYYCPATSQKMTISGTP